MLNKKIVAAAVAAAFTQSAVAVVDLDAAGSQLVTYASELVTGTTGTLDVTNAGNILDVTTTLGFSIGAGTTKYVRIDLTNATFDAVPTLGVTSAAPLSVSLSAGGVVGGSFAIFEISATGVVDIQASDVVLLQATNYEVSDSATSNVAYGLYDTAPGAANSLAADRLKSVNKDFTVLASANSGEFATGINNVATVDSGFANFNASSIGMTTAAVGVIDTDDLVGLSVFTPAGLTVTDVDLLDVADGGDQAQTLSFTGDFSFGTWTLNSAANCAGAMSAAVTVVAATASSEASVPSLPTATLTANDWWLCVVVDGTEQILKGDYTATLTESILTDAMGTISYDTTSIEVPYITTLADYNQRIYIINSGTTDAAYSFTFVSEAAATATPGPDATGIVPAGEMIALRTDQIVTTTGRTRTSAVIEVEGIDADIQAATQTVAPDGSTDTVVLNANSIKSRLELDL